LAPEREPSSPAQNSLGPLALLGILVSALALFTLKRNQSRESIQPQDTTQIKGNLARRKSPIIPDIPPAPPQSNTPKEGKDDTPPWKKRAEIAAVLIALGLLVVNICQMRSTEKAATAAETANKNAQAALTVSEQANVTIGRPDGTVADIIWPKGQGNAGLLVYFQNTGHLPAKFNWGNESPIIAVLPTDAKAIKEPYEPGAWPDFTTDHVFQPMWRAKSRKQAGSFGWSGTITIAGNSAYQGILWEIPKARMLQLMKWDRPFMPHGKFEYCDGFGNHVCRRFSLQYAREPYNRLFLAAEDECATWEMQVLNPNPDLEYLSPCEIQERREELKGSIKTSPKP
jgi:hypothetical protein